MAKKDMTLLEFVERQHAPEWFWWTLIVLAVVF